MFKLTLVTPEKKVLIDEEMSDLLVSGYKGELNILPGHAPMVTTLETSLLRYKLKGDSDFTAIAVSWGYLEVHTEGVNILAETAESKKDVDMDRAKNTLAKANELLASGDLSAEDVEKYRQKVKRAEIRLSL